VPKTIAIALALSTYDAALLRDVALALVHTAQQPDAHPLSLLQTVPGMGTSLRRGLLYASPDIGRLLSVQDCASAARLVKGRKESAGKRWDTSGKNSGNAHLQWACAEAATLCLRHPPNGQTLLTRLEKNPGTGQALTILAPTRARAV